MDKKDSPIGIFDSGIGGLTVARTVRALVPSEDIVYVGDSARVPYGSRSPGTIVRYSLEIANFLLQCKVKLLVAACNSISAVALTDISRATNLPLVDVISAGTACALKTSKNRRIGVIGTTATINSEAYQRAIHRVDGEVEVFSRACPLFVPLTEEGHLNSKATEILAREYLAPLLDEGVDTLILGCTHYPLLKPLLQEIAGPSVTMIDSASAVASEIYGRLQQANMLKSPGSRGEMSCFVTDDPEYFRLKGKKFLGLELDSVRLISLTGEQNE